MNSVEIMERFRRFVQADLSHRAPNRMQQVSEVLLETSTVRIILTRYVCGTEDSDVEIEVSLPLLSATADTIKVQESIDSLIAMLEYLKRLTFMGFGLEILKDEGMLIASARLSEDTEEDVFKALDPSNLLQDSSRLS
jgi:hypothetical protein